MYGRNPWTDPEPDWQKEDDEFWEDVDRAYERRQEEAHGETMSCATGHSEQETEYV